MKLLQHTFTVETNGRGCYPITQQLTAWLQEQSCSQGILHLFVQHTSCSFIIQENADPDVLHDMETFMQRLVPDGDPSFLHQDEGPDDMPAHIRMALTQVSLHIPILEGHLGLGLWQGIYLYEHRFHPMRRRVIVSLLGTS